LVKLNQASIDYANQAADYLVGADYASALRVYDAVMKDEGCRGYVWAELGRRDLFFLVTLLLGRSDVFHPWLYERCRDVEREEADVLDLWARTHYKTTLKTFARNIQRVLNDPEVTIGIFSHTGKIADAFLRQIKHELEQNDLLKGLYPDILYSDPRKESSVWSIQTGLIVKRKTNPVEATFESWGLVDSQPVSKHFKVLCYDDVVTQASVSTAEQIEKTTDAWELSQHLLTDDGGICVYAGTRYNFADTYKVMLERGAVKPRLFPATDDGTPDGEPVFLSREKWEDKKRKSSTYTIACQMLQNPLAGSEQEFKPEWLRYFEIRPETLNVAILVDPANSRKKGSSNTAMAVIGIDYAWNRYLLDGVCHRMGLNERWKTLKRLRFRWLNRPGIQVVKVGYERYGMQADLEHFEEMMRIEKCPFPIDEVSWVREGSQSKDDRIRRLVPDFQNWKFFLPYNGKGLTKDQREATLQGKRHLVAKPIVNKNHDGRTYNLIDWFISNEYLFFPATTAKDFLDAMSRVYDLEMSPPQIIEDEGSLIPEGIYGV